MAMASEFLRCAGGGIRQRVGCFQPLPFPGTPPLHLWFSFPGPQRVPPAALVSLPLALGLKWVHLGERVPRLREKAATDISAPLLAAARLVLARPRHLGRPLVPRGRFCTCGLVLYFIWLFCGFGQESWSAANYFFCFLRL